MPSGLMTELVVSGLATAVTSQCHNPCLLIGCLLFSHDPSAWPCLQCCSGLYPSWFLQLPPGTWKDLGHLPAYCNNLITLYPLLGSQLGH